MSKFYQGYHPVVPSGCRCDNEFVQFLEQRSIVGKRIFHFGTGIHHQVGLWCSRPEHLNSVYAVTASRTEHCAYQDFLEQSPAHIAPYVVVFANIYSTNWELLPQFDYINLFHLGEYSNFPHEDEVLMARAARSLAPGGEMVLFNGSTGFDRIKNLIPKQLKSVGVFETLEFYRATN